MDTKRNRFPVYILSLFVLGVIWESVARYINAPLILPSPAETFRMLVSLCGTKSFWIHIGATSFRCFVSFILSVFAGTIIGTLCGISPFFSNFFEVPVAIIRATPVISFILLALFWFSSSQVPVFVSFLMTLPVMITAVFSGFQKTDSDLCAMAQVYGLTRFQKFRFITLPAVKPFFLNGCVSSFGLTWKVVAAGEVISLPKYGTGTILQMAQVHLETAEVIAVTIVLVTLSFSIEKLFAYVVRTETVSSGAGSIQ